MLSHTPCTVSEVPPLLTCLSSLLKPKPIFHETNGSCNFETNTKHCCGNITTTPTMSDHNDNDNTNTTGTQEDPRAKAREERKKSRQMIAKVKEDVRKRITEEDLRKILSAPMEKRDRLNSIVNDPEIIWEYVPCQHDGLAIDLWRAKTILSGVTDSVLREKLKKIPGYAWASKIRQPDGICRYVVHYYRGQGFSLPDFLKDLPFVTSEEKVWQPSGFKYDSVGSGSKLYPQPDFSLTLPQEFNGWGTVGFIGTLDRGTHVTKVHVLVTVGHVLADQDASTCGVEININDPTQMVQLRPVDEFTYELDDDGKPRPTWRFQRGLPYNPCLDEICLISTENLPNHVIPNCQFPRPIDCNLFFTSIPEQDINTTHYPGVLHNVDDVIAMLDHFMPLTVYKNGASTGLTTGTLVEFRPYSQCIDTTDFSNADDFHCMVIKWTHQSELDRFPDSGDSGSLVYAMHDDRMVPLGIHFASDERKYESYAHLLWYWCEALESSLDVEILFCDTSCS